MKGRIPLVTVLIITFNRAEKLRRSLKSVNNQDYKSLQIIVIDNASTDNTGDVVTETCPEAQYIRLHKNTGVCLSRNIGIANASAEYIYLLDDDGWLETDAISKCVPLLLEHPSLAAVESRLIDVKDDKAVHCYKGDIDKVVFISTFVECCSLIRKRAVVDAGCFDDDLFYGAEGEELSLRLLYAGYYCCYQPSSVMYHELRNKNVEYNWQLTLLLRNANRVALWHWPEPYRTLRLLNNIRHVIRLSIKHKKPILPFKVLWSLGCDWSVVKQKRNSKIDAQAFKWYLQVGKKPTTSNVDNLVIK